MFKKYISRILLSGLAGLVLAFLVAKLTKPIYEGRVELLLGEQAGQNNRNASVLGEEVTSILQRAAPGGARTERQLLSSQSVFFRAVNNVATRRNEPSLRDDWIDLFKMYDIETARTTTNDPNQDAGVARLLVRTHNAESAADIANEISYVYNDVRREQSKQAVAEALRYVTVQIDLSKKSLDAAESALKDYKSKEGIVNIEIAQRDIASLKASVDLQIQNLSSQISGAEAQIASFEAMKSGRPEKETSSESRQKPSAIVYFENRLSELKSTKSSLQQRYLDDSVEIRQVDQQIRDTYDLIAKAKKSGAMEQSAEVVGNEPVRQSIDQQLAQVKASRDGARQQLAQYKEQEAALQTQIKAMPLKEQELIVKQREVRILEDKYARLKVQQEELRDRGETGVRVAFILNKAAADPDQIAPDLQKWSFIGFLGGLALGLIFVVTGDALKLRARSSSQLTELTGLPVLAAIPALPRNSAQGSLRGLSRAETVPAEAFRYMTYSMMAKDGNKMYVFTGIKSSVGTYNSAVQFAISMAKSGSKVLLVDADLYRAPITKNFDAAGKPGLSDLISGDSAIGSSSVIVETNHKNLTLLPAGNGEAKFLTDAEIARVEQVLTSLKSGVDMVIVAAPPCDVLADAASVAPLADEVCLVVSAANTPYKSIPQAYEVLHRAGAKQVSFILTEANPDEEPFARKRAYLARGD